MFGGQNRLIVAALVVGAFLVTPSAALSCGGGPSAQNVYSECVPTGGGGKSTTGGGGKSANGGPSGNGSRPISGPAARAIKQAGKDSRLLASLVSGYGVHRRLGSDTGSGAATSPTALGSALDLGSGPMALLLGLAGTAFLLLSASGLRVWRARRRA